MERRKTLGHLRSINRNMIIHFANQSQTCQLLKILTRSLYVASFLVIFFFFFFLKIPVRCIFPGHFHSLFCYILVQYPCTLDFPSHLHFHSVALLFIFPEFWKWSGAPFPFCIVLLPHSYTDLSLHLSLADSSCTLWQFVYFFLALSAKSFCDCKYLSTIACASEDTFGESMAAKFLLDNSPLFDIYGVPSRLLFATCTSTLDMLDFSTHVLLTAFLLCRPIISFTNFIKSLSLQTRWGKSDTLDCHMGVTWFDAARWLAVSRRLIIFLSKYCDMF